MLRINLDINGRDIGMIGVLNTQKYNGGEIRYEIYDIRGIEGGESITEYPQIGEVMHPAQKGAATLTREVMREVEEEKHLDTEPYR